MTNASVHRLLDRIGAPTLVGSLIAAAALVSLAIWIAPFGGVGLRLLMVAAAMVPCLGALAVVLTLQHAERSLATQPQVDQQSVHGVAYAQQHAAPAQGVASLDKALGAAHMRELRAHVDLLCTMSTLDRMGPALLDELRHSGVSTLATQAAVSAHVVRRILAGPDLGAGLMRTGITVNHPAIEELQGDLDAIAVSLMTLSERVRDSQARPVEISSEIESREKMMAGIAPVDHLLLQSTLLLSAVSDMARILAAIHTRYSSRSTGVQTISGETTNGNVGEFDVSMLDIPAWKLN